MRIRPIRALTLGFPNVGKSALINRIAKRVVDSARKAGVTRNLRWIKLESGIDLLDAPGVIPPNLEDQKSALNLALCDDIGEAAYEIESVAIGFIKIYPLSTKIRIRISQLNKYLIDMELILIKALRVLLLGSTKQLQKIPLAIKENVS